MKRTTLISAIGLMCVGSLALAAETAKHEPNWESLDKRPTPQWFQDARFGISIHWGLYSVPAWAPKGQHAADYWNSIEKKEGETWKRHVKAYGKNFEYKQFAPKFEAKEFNPGEWADLFTRSGARYVVLSAKGPDGYCLWPSAQSPNWNSMDVGPKRDLLGDLTKSVRKAGLKMGISYSLCDWHDPLYRSDAKRYVEERMIPQFKDVVQRYTPSVVFVDDESEHPDKTWKSEELLAWLFDESPCRDEVAVNDRLGKDCRGRHGGYWTSESGGAGETMSSEHMWEENQPIGRSFGLNRNEGPGDYKTTRDLIRLLVNCVSGGGNLLLDIGPDADGTIPQNMKDRLLEMGAWLKANGESIYGATAGPLQKLSWGRTTAKPGKIFLHVYEWPKGDLEVPGLRAKVKCAYMLSDPDHTWLMLGRSADGWITITTPAKAPDPFDSVVVLEMEGEAQVKESKPIVQSDDGTIALRAVDATVHGEAARYESGGGKDNIGYWTDEGDWVSWKFDLKTPGKFRVEIAYACAQGSGDSEYTVGVADNRQVKGKIRETGSWTNFVTETLGVVELAKPGPYTLSVRPTSKPGQAVMNLKAITLRPAKE